MNSMQTHYSYWLKTRIWEWFDLSWVEMLFQQKVQQIMSFLRVNASNWPQRVRTWPKVLKKKCRWRLEFIIVEKDSKWSRWQRIHEFEWAKKSTLRFWSSNDHIFTEKERSEWIQGHLWSINWVFNHTRSKVFVFLRIMGKRKMEQ